MPKPQTYTHTQNFLLTLQLFGDVLLCFAGLSLGYWLRFESPLRIISFEPTAVSNYLDYLPLLALGTAFFIGACAHLRLYDPRFLLRPNEARSIIFRGVFFWFIAFLSTSLVLKFQPPISRLFVTVSSLITLVILIGWRSVFHLWLTHSRLRDRITQRVALVGWTQEASDIAEAILKDQYHPYEIIGIIATPAGSTAMLAPTHPFLGHIDRLENAIAIHRLDIVIIADPDLSKEQLMAAAAKCERGYASLKVAPSFFQIFISNLRLQTISGTPILGVEEMPLETWTNSFAKRAIDIVGALVGLLISLPIIAVLAVLIKRESPTGPVFFRQTRIGAGHRSFQLFKLRSMNPDASRHDNETQSTRLGDQRLLRIGSFMRRWNLDELPQFWNVLRGEMSLVGPRPERPYHVEQLAREIPHYQPRHLVKPGITGWAQVNGLRGDTSLVERIKYDLYYIENWSLWFDFQILALTFVRRQNAY
jgi:exopolysaccharide biosynthesis polyprenyl glycosylphosphotransferase